MGDALAELELKLRSSKDKLTREEERVLQQCKAKAVRDFMTGALVASGITWAVTSKLSLSKRLNTAGAAAVVSGIWGFEKGLNLCLDHVLSLDGSRLQKELATILLTKHNHNSWRMQLVRRHYYLEKVFDDLNMEEPFSRWRRRCVSGDAWSVQRKCDTQNHEGTMENLPSATGTDVSGSSDAQDFLADPLEFIFGHPKRTEDAHTDVGAMTQRRHSHRHRRAARKHKISTPTANHNQ